MKRTLSVIIVIAFVICLFGCSDYTTATNEQAVEQPTAQEIQQAEISGECRYLMILSVKQSHFTLDLSEHLKDMANELEIPVMVDREFYYQYEVGDTITESFRVGSALVNGSYGSWGVSVKSKEIIPENY
jgi:hypothetical protein